MTGLTLGALDLMGVDQSGPFYIEALGSDSTLGNPEPIVREIESFLQDGAIEAVDSYGNREMSFPVRITGEDSPGLAAGEQALMAEVRRRNVLTWTPPNPLGDGDPCVFDVVRSEIDHTFDDLLEVQSYQRVYTLSIKALPHARSPISRAVSLAAPAGVAATVTTINDCTSTAGWTTYPSSGGTFAASGGAVRLDWSHAPGGDDAPGTQSVIYLARQNMNVSIPAGQLIRIDFTSGGTGRFDTQTDVVYINDQLVTPVASNGSVRWYPNPGPVFNNLLIQTRARLSRYGKLFLSVADISRTNMAGDLAGSRQIFGTVDVKGSARTEATITVADETPTGLGSVLVYTAPNTGQVAQPPLRARLVPGPTETANAGLISGKSSDLATVHSFDIPVSQVPAGSYLLMARIKHASGGARQIFWAGRSRMGGTELTSTTISNSRTITLAADTWTIAPIALMALPTRMMGDAGVVRVELQGPAGTLLDEAWIFNMDLGSLSQVDCGAGTPAVGGSSNRLWLTPPSLGNPVASAVRGMAADQSDAMFPGLSLGALDTHEFIPPSMNLFVVTSDSVSMQVNASYNPRFHTHVVED